MTADSEEHDGSSETGVSLSKGLLLTMFVGFALIVVGMVIVLLSTGFGGGSASFGGVIFIGPFPIVFGAGPEWTWLVAIGIALAVLSIIIFVIMRKRI